MISAIKEAGNLYRAAQLIKEVEEVVPRNMIGHYTNKKTRELEYFVVYKSRIYSYPDGFYGGIKDRPAYYIPCAYKGIPIKVLDEWTDKDEVYNNSRNRCRRFYHNYMYNPFCGHGWL